ncbi:hypothetical protein Y032_0177g596 [Ancylostoma ceylanicum]|uniref:Uncharacterized protein n=1 Tax=Ancylostoma ceylanicum TaxID=53326 RepID=A0A016SU90_9BILA|nr:hypothetical protein Y032_0177g596 [Ancylostoma ceylanicum]
MGDVRNVDDPGDRSGEIEDYYADDVRKLVELVSRCYVPDFQGFQPNDTIIHQPFVTKPQTWPSIIIMNAGGRLRATTEEAEPLIYKPTKYRLPRIVSCVWTSPVAMAQDSLVTLI